MKSFILIILFFLIGASSVLGQTNMFASLKSFAHAPTDQGVLPTSGAHALCSALAIERNLQRGMKDSIVFSASYLFNSLKEGRDCEQGIRISDALRFLKKEGVCPTAVFPNSRYDCEPPPRVPQNSLHRIRGAKRLFNLKMEATKKVEAVQRALDDSRPVVVVLYGDLGFDALASASEDWRLAPLAPDDGASTQFQAMVVVGYDKSSRTFELMGSYGHNWGDGGFARSAFEDFGKIARYAFILDSGPFDW